MTEKEVPRESEIWCAYCGAGWSASWDVVSVEKQRLTVCGDHRFVLKQTQFVMMEKKTGEDMWMIVDPTADLLDEHHQEDMGDWKNLI